MLAEMGLRVWSPLQGSAPAPEAAEQRVPVSSESASPAGALDIANATSTTAAASTARGPVAAVQALPAGLRPNSQSGADLPQHADPAARLPAIAAMDWLELRHSAAECRACALCGGRSKSVFGAGPSRADWLVVGEAPGEPEDALGEPFTGQTLQLLGNMLRAIDVSFDASPDAALPPERLAYLSLALKCRPAPGSTPGPEELQQCRPYLDRQIALLKPRIIFAMGRLAVQALLGSNEPLGRLRGRVHAYQGSPVIATFAPAYLLRNPSEKARAWEDLCLARATLQGLGPR